MASCSKAVDEENVNCFKKCSICSEQFKDPRFLPCLHSFCNGCLTSYIQTSCQLKEIPLGFRCPLCQQFTPAPRISVAPNEWSEHFPINQILFEISNQNDLMCGACGRDGEKNRATDFCISCMEALCDNCSKYHRKNRASSNHKLCTVKDIQKTDILAVVSSKATCWVHKERSIELYCNDHEEPCCTMCVSTKHRKCDSVETVEEKAKKLRENGAGESLLIEVKETENCLCAVKKKQEKNMSNFNDHSEKVISEIRYLEGEMVRHIQRLKTDSLNEISRLTKQGKETMMKNVEMLGDQIQMMQFCATELQKASSQSDVDFVVGYRKQKQMLESLKKAKSVPLCITLNSVYPDNLISFEKIPRFAEFNMQKTAEESKIFVKRPKQLIKCFETHAENANITSMLNDGNKILFTNTKWLNEQGKRSRKVYHENGFTLLEYSLSDEKVQFERYVNIQVRPYGIVGRKGNLYVSSSEDGIRRLFLQDEEYDGKKQYSVQNYRYDAWYPFNERDSKLRPFYQGDNCFGLEAWKDFLFVACSNKVHKIGLDGNILRTYRTSAGVHHVLVIDSGHLVLSNEDDHIVTAINEEGDLIWKYQRPNLIKPKGINKDSTNNIYVSSFGSNSVHVLTCEGAFLHIFENIPNPVFFKLIDGRNVAILCSNHDRIVLYKVS